MPDNANLSAKLAHWASYLDAVAAGVEARQEQFSGRLEMTIQETAGIARSLGMPEDQVRKWALERRACVIEKASMIESIINRLDNHATKVTLLDMAPASKAKTRPRSAK